MKFKKLEPTTLSKRFGYDPMDFSKFIMKERERERLENERHEARIREALKKP